jgi:hypothetical protein
MLQKKILMIDLKKYNYFTGDKSSLAYGVSDIVKFLDLAGYNYVLFTPPKPTGSSKIYDVCLYHHLDNKIEFENIDDFTEKIENKSNLFRVDLIVFDLWSLKKMNRSRYFKVIENLSQKFIIVTKEFEYKTTDDVNDFHIRTEYKDLYKSENWLTDKISGTTTTLESLKMSYIRDKKLEYLFKN